MHSAKINQPLPSKCSMRVQKSYIQSRTQKGGRAWDETTKSLHTYSISLDLALDNLHCTLNAFGYVIKTRVGKHLPLGHFPRKESELHVHVIRPIMNNLFGHNMRYLNLVQYTLHA